jgi:hypothetical protein|tara:strand:+ start:1106 stop:1474 length:369 start_codon:yes stop_codon:yes gene_type:complete
MKKFTTNQWLLLGGAIGIVYILYKKRKNKGSDLIEEALDVVSNGGAGGGTRPMEGYETGGIKPMPSNPSTTVTQGTGIIPDKMLRCRQLINDWNVIESKTTWENKDAMLKARASFLGACDTN